MWETQGKFRKKKISVSDLETNNNYISICFFFDQYLLPRDVDVLIRLLSNTSRHIKIK